MKPPAGRQGFSPPDCAVSVTPRRSRDTLDQLGTITFKKVVTHGVAHKRRVVRKVRLFQNVRPVGTDGLTLPAALRQLQAPCGGWQRAGAPKPAPRR